jgi:predicted O-linked N-acetylglucosamine transferase (SPINDLY family)
LRREARARGVDPLRLVFARGVPYPQHLARLPLADLCLDTIPFNGGATGSDALWAGVPVVTCSGKSYAARMTGSLLHALGLPGLVTHSLPEYRKLALQLALDRGRLSEVRATLSLRKNTSPLFDTDRFRRHLEAAYRAMIARHETGQRPADLAIPAIPP